MCTGGTRMPHATADVVVFAFYEPITLSEHLISLLTAGPFCHCDVRVRGQAFTAYRSTGVTCERPRTDAAFEVRLYTRDAARCERYLRSRVGTTPYMSWYAILTSIVCGPREDRAGLVCSELCRRALVRCSAASSHCGGGDSFMSPNALQRALIGGCSSAPRSL